MQQQVDQPSPLQDALSDPELLQGSGNYDDIPVALRNRRAINRPRPRSRNMDEYVQKPKKRNSEISSDVSMHFIYKKTT